MDLLFLCLIVLLVGIWIGFNIGQAVKEKQLRNKILDRESILDCFKDVDWSNQRFFCGDNVMKTPDGIEHFYKVPSISAAIEKLNALLNSAR